MSTRGTTARRGRTNTEKSFGGKRSSEWQVVLPEKLRAEAAEIADVVANRLIDTDLLVQNFEDIARGELAKDFSLWNPSSLMHGFPSLALMCYQLERCEPGVGWGKVGTQFMKIASQNHLTERHASFGSVADGTSGFGLAATFCPSRSSWRKQTCESMISPSCQYALDLIDSFKDRSLLNARHFDALYGISGVGRFLLSTLPDAQSEATLHRILEALIHLSCEYDGILGFYTPHSALDEVQKKTEPSGLINTGLAHGVPGPLMLMSLAVLRGVEVSGLPEAVRRVADWIVKQKLYDETGLNWPRCISIKDTNTEIPPVVPSRVAWCYGTPGIARTLWVAGNALGEPSYKEVALQSMEAALKKTPAQQRIDTPTLCHGVSGVLDIALRFAVETKEPFFLDAAGTLTEQVISYYNENNYWGFQESIRTIKCDSPGLLMGAAGIVLSLLAAAYPVEPQWDAVLLIS